MNKLIVLCILLLCSGIAVSFPYYEDAGPRFARGYQSGIPLAEESLPEQYQRQSFRHYNQDAVLNPVYTHVVIPETYQQPRKPYENVAWPNQQRYVPQRPVQEPVPSNNYNNRVPEQLTVQNIPYENRYVEFNERPAVHNVEEPYEQVNNVRYPQPVRPEPSVQQYYQKPQAQPQEQYSQPEYVQNVLLRENNENQYRVVENNNNQQLPQRVQYSRPIVETIQETIYDAPVSHNNIVVPAKVSTPTIISEEYSRPVPEKVQEQRNVPVVVNQQPVRNYQTNPRYYENRVPVNVPQIDTVAPGVNGGSQVAPINTPQQNEQEPKSPVQEVPEVKSTPVNAINSPQVQQIEPSKNEQPSNVRRYNIQELIAKSKLKNIMSSTKLQKKYLVVHPDGRIEHVDDLQPVTAKHPTYVLVNAGDIIQNPSQVTPQVENDRENQNKSPIKSDKPADENPLKDVLLNSTNIVVPQQQENNKPSEQPESKVDTEPNTASKIPASNEKTPLEDKESKPANEPSNKNEEKSSEKPSESKVDTNSKDAPKTNIPTGIKKSTPAKPSVQIPIDTVFDEYEGSTPKNIDVEMDFKSPNVVAKAISQSQPSKKTNSPSDKQKVNNKDKSDQVTDDKQNVPMENSNAEKAKDTPKVSPKPVQQENEKSEDKTQKAKPQVSPVAEVSPTAVPSVKKDQKSPVKDSKDQVKKSTNVEKKSKPSINKNETPKDVDVVVKGDSPRKQNPQEAKNKFQAKPNKNVPLVKESQDISGGQSDEEPFLWFRTTDDEFWKKFSNGQDLRNVVYVFQVHSQPIIEKDVTRTIHPNGTVVEELTETVWKHEDDSQPIVTKTSKVITPDEDDEEDDDSLE